MRRLPVFWLPLVTAVLLLVVAEIAQRSGLFPITVAAPSQVWQVLVGNPRLFGETVVPTLQAALIGYLCEAAAALAAASVASLIAPAWTPIYRFGVALSSIPLTATTPLLVVWIGNGLSTRVLIAALASYFPILVGAMQGFRAFESTSAELFHVLSASPLQRLRLLVIPASLPLLFAGLKIAAPSAILGTILAEWAGAERGLGVLMIYALGAFDVPKVWFAVTASCLLAAAVYALAAAIEMRVVRWQAATVLED